MILVYIFAVRASKIPASHLDTDTLVHYSFSIAPFMLDAEVFIGDKWQFSAVNSRIWYISSSKIILIPVINNNNMPSFRVSIKMEVKSSRSSDVK